MRKVFLFLPAIALLAFSISSCRNDDGQGIETVPPLPRGPQSLVDQDVIEEYLSTHFYNYEEFENPSSDFDFKIRFDTIAGDNADKTPLLSQVEFKMVQDREETDVEYKLYYLNVIEGGGKSIKFPDVATMSFEGTSILRREIVDENDLDGDGNTAENLEILDIVRFDSANSPIQLDLTQIVNGLQDALVEFKTATQIIENNDGTLSFENHGVGAVFAPSGLGYYTVPPPMSGIPIYAELIFTFQTFDVRIGDQDGDGVPTSVEDRNGNLIEEDDDSDVDTLPDFLDNDDDNDLRLTLEEIETNEYTISPGNEEPVLAPNEVEVDREIDPVTGAITISTIILTDTDGDGIADYLDSDS